MNLISLASCAITVAPLSPSSRRGFQWLSFARDHALRVGQPKFAAAIVGAMPRDPLGTDRRILPIGFEKLLGVSPKSVQRGKRRQRMIHG
jgi:hypothetical protein